MQQHGLNMVEIVQVSLFQLNNSLKTTLVDMLFTLICIILKVNLGVGEVCFTFCDL